MLNEIKEILKIDKNETITFLEERGWFRWYHDEAWCHHRFDYLGDCTYYAVTTKIALAYENDLEARKIIDKGLSLRKSMKEFFSDLAFKNKKKRNK